MSDLYSVALGDYRKDRIMKLKVILVILLLGGEALMAFPAMSSECSECHKSPVFKVQHKKLFDYYVEFQNSVHGVAGLDCSDCHGGNPNTRDMKVAHEGVLARVKYDRIPETCGACHEDQERAFVASDHYRILQDKGTAPNCVTCHGAMEMDFIFSSRVKATCMFCHNRETNNHPGIPDRADYILSKINIIKGYRSFVETNAKDRKLVAELGQRYRELSAKWHRFDLDEVELDTQNLLGSYRAAKAQAVKDKRKD